VSAAGKKIPVLVSPVVVMAGSDTVPAEKVATPVADSVPVERAVNPDKAPASLRIPTEF
jgi:hypothetical protein